MSRRFHALVFALSVSGAPGCSSDDNPQTPGPGSPDAAGGGSAGSGASGGSGGGTGDASGGTGGSGGSSGSTGSGGSSASGGTNDGGGSCTAASDCGSSQDCCVRMSIENDVLESASAACNAACAPREGSTGSGALITSVSCSTAGDCSGVRNEFGVAYSECCSIPGFDVGVCVSETYAFATFEPAGGTCL